MEEQLISFETAKLAKEKGFNIDTNIRGYYLFKNDPYNRESNLLWNDSVTDREVLLCYAPSHSFLSNWILSQHSINIELTFDDGQWLIYVGEFSFPDSSVELVGNIECRNFEEAKHKKLEALEKGLQEALKLIKNLTKN